jgi:hypothetical protein
MKRVKPDSDADRKILRFIVTVVGGRVPSEPIQFLVSPERNYVWLKYNVLAYLTIPETARSLFLECVDPLPLSTLRSGVGGFLCA